MQLPVVLNELSLLINLVLWGICINSHIWIWIHNFVTEELWFLIGTESWSWPDASLSWKYTSVIGGEGAFDVLCSVSQLYVEYIVKNPASISTHSLDSELFSSRLEAFIKSLPYYSPRAAWYTHRQTHSDVCVLCRSRHCLKWLFPLCGES